MGPGPRVCCFSWWTGYDSSLWMVWIGFPSETQIVGKPWSKAWHFANDVWSKCEIVNNMKQVWSNLQSHSTHFPGPWSFRWSPRQLHLHGSCDARHITGITSVNQWNVVSAAGNSEIERDEVLIWWFFWFHFWLAIWSCLILLLQDSCYITQAGSNLRTVPESFTRSWRGHLDQARWWEIARGRSFLDARPNSNLSNSKQLANRMISK